MGEIYGYIISIRGQIGCMCILLYIAWTYFSVRRRDTVAHRLFSVLIIVSIIDLIFDVITVYTVNHAEEVPLVINRLVHVIFVASLTTILFVIYMYIRTLAYNEFKFKYHWLIPLIASCTAVALLPFGYEVSIYGNYSSGPFLTVAFVCAYTYFFLGLILLIRKHKQLEKKSFYAIAISLFTMMSVTVIQGIFKELLITSIAVTIINVALFYTVESPDALLIEMLEDERKKADSANQAKSLFLAQMSHEIRTPINAILGMNEMILRSADKEVREYSVNINEAGKTLLALINSILDFSKIEDGKMEILKVAYDTSSVINNLVHSISGRAASKGLDFVLDVDPDLPATLIGDDVRITQIIMNLLTNAVKYTDRGSVKLSVKETGREGRNINLYIAVEDTGIGIKQENIGQLFASFQRIEEERNRNIEGTGLGIAIVSRLLGMMDSHLEVKSEYEVGSTFSFRLTQQIEDDTPIGDINKRMEDSLQQPVFNVGFKAPGARVLVVDDNFMNLKVAGNLLSLYEITPDFASGGVEAIEKMQQNHYDIVCMDHMMPQMDGIETFNKLKEKDLIPSDTIMLMMTANAVVGAKEDYLKVGFTDYISKPIELERMEEKLRMYLPGSMIQNKEKQEDNVSGDDFEVLEFEAFEGSSEDEDLADEDKGTLLKNGLELIGIDYDAGMRYCTQSLSFYEEILNDFVKSFDEKSKDMNSAYEIGDMDRYAIVAHSIKSTSKMIGANELSGKAREQEFFAKDKDTASVIDNHERLADMYKKTVDDIEKLLRSL